jgi:RND superfamily putative drug exporter
LQVVVVDHGAPIASDPAAQGVMSHVTQLLRSDPRVSTVVAPRAGVSVSPDGRTAIITAGAAADPNAMVKAAEHLAGPIGRAGTSTVTAALTGDSALWANFNSANHSAMMRSELLSWPVTMARPS